MVVLKQTGKGHGRMYKFYFAERVSGMVLLQSPCAYLHCSDQNSSEYFH